MSRTKHIIIISLFVVVSISLLSTVKAFAGQARRTLMEDSTANESKKQTAEESTKQGSAKTSSTANSTDKDPSSKEPTSSIAGSGLAQPTNQTSAQPPNQPAKSQWPQQSQGTFELLYKPLGATFLVCALAIGFLTVYRKYSGNKRAADAPIAIVLATLPLGDKRSLNVVKVGNEILVLGNTPNAITLLTQMREEQETVPSTQTVSNHRQKVQAVQPIEDFTRHLKEEMERKAQTRASEPQFARVRQSLLGIQ